MAEVCDLSSHAVSICVHAFVLVGGLHSFLYIIYTRMYLLVWPYWVLVASMRDP